MATTCTSKDGWRYSMPSFRGLTQTLTLKLQLQLVPVLVFPVEGNGIAAGTPHPERTIGKLIEQHRNRRRVHWLPHHDGAASHVERRLRLVVPTLTAQWINRERLIGGRLDPRVAAVIARLKWLPSDRLSPACHR